MASSPELTLEPLPPHLQDDYLRLAVREIGECLADLGRVLAQGAREDNVGTRGSIAAGLERAARHIRGEREVVR
ncbi:hypothetical protein [Granulibacter bethesdensis]|uniref:Uncharacterized protein n=2 Tax=Granulibacter bethesdensis TaxID=364410 RepID=Q0BQ48_GRABC|nr:hypothetical protein [Granulibacter bethesdensis]ABI63054.1 Hypothetical protein GbCGDNIH1_2156 [Granulibacter bethesdensis CGDNIH1]AHJ64054.1 Hypothetical protein GbCGDNIH3_2156 [Granulibacter bethesdensis]AHJ65360.1 Hypothetical protein GbCGDNIH4_2156 [Granulibacter bethesdensis CGDNIH4]AHJ67980.1 Hypothetical protein GbCGDNIH2_2156 [Granulibacter bethesdensis]APH52927.1 Hypothetical protein GbCGDNIH5_2156 [Granulibacter bethesdensis]